MAVADPALVDHGAVVRHLDRLADAGLAALHYAQLVRCVVYSQGRHFVSWEPLPADAEIQMTTSLHPFQGFGAMKHVCSMQMDCAHFIMNEF